MDKKNGLNNKQVIENREKYGRNSISSKKKDSFIETAEKVVKIKLI